MEDCKPKVACIGRREFLVKAGLVAGVTVLTVSSSYGASAFEDLTVTIVTDSPLAKVGGSQVVDSTAGKLIVIRSGEKTFAAFSAICTHKRGTLSYDGKQLNCPKHGSKFNAENGTVSSGPAETPVKSYAVKAGDGSVTVAVM